MSLGVGGVKASPSREFTIGGHCTLQKYTLKVLNLNGRISIFLDQVPCAQIVLCVHLGKFRKVHCPLVFGLQGEWGGTRPRYVQDMD